MMTFFKKLLIGILAVIFLFIGVLAAYLGFFISNPEKPATHTYGITFSKPFAKQMGLDWKETYLAILDELRPDALRLVAYWPEVEPGQNVLDFTDLDWQVEEATRRGVSVMLSMGQKLPRWPECHYPAWLRDNVAREKREALSHVEQEELLAYVREVVAHYRNNSGVKSWQVENEPFLPFGICPMLDEALLDREIAAVRELDPSRPIIISESGEFSTWFGAARRADVIGTTLYRVVWWKATGYVRYPIPEEFYWKKVGLIKNLFGKDVMIIELQAEPWAHLQLYENTVEEMMKSMSPRQFVENLRYAHASRFSTMYLWGAEWWYWMKERQQNSFYWDTIKDLSAQRLVFE